MASVNTYILNNKEYPIEIIRKNNKNTYLRVKEGKIIVTTNYLTSSFTINKLIKDNTSFINKALLKENKKKEDTSFKLFGMSYDIVYGFPNTEIDNNKIYTKDEKTLNKYLSKYITNIYKERLDYYYNIFKEQIPIPNLKIRKMTSRWGNFINKEAHGAITTYEHLKELHIPEFIIDGMKINGFYYIPTFLYESVWCIIGFVILLIVRKKDNFKHTGLLLYIYFIWYGIGRLIIEGLRTDSLYLGVFRISQIVSIILILIGIIGIIYRRIKWKNIK